MATLVLGIAGSALGGPIGGAVGASIGSILDNQLFLPLLFPPDAIEGPRLDAGQRVMRSNEGAPLPYPMGQRTRYGGVMMWPSDFELEEVVTKRRVGGGLFGVGGQTIREYKYYATLAICIGLVDSGDKVQRVRQLYADAKKLWSGSGAPIKADAIRFYDGTQTTADPLISAWFQSTEDDRYRVVGDQNVPTFNGMAYLVVERLQTEDFGRRVPELNVSVVEDANKSVAGAISDVMSSHGIESSEYDVTRVRQCFTGMNTMGPASARAKIQPMMTAYSLNVLQLGGKMVFTEKGNEAQFRFLDADLVASAPDAIGGMGVVYTEDGAYEAPTQVEATYVSMQNDLQEGTEVASHTTDSESITTISLPLTLYDREASAMVNRVLWESQTGGLGMQANLPPGYAFLVSGDALRNEDGQLYRVGTVNLSPTYDIDASGTRYVPEVYTQDAFEDEDDDDDGVYEPPNLTTIFLDLPALSNEQNATTGYYLSAITENAIDDFEGATIYASGRENDVASTDPSVLIPDRPAVGVYAGGLSTDTLPHCIDGFSELIVDFRDGAPLDTGTVDRDLWLNRESHVLAVLKSNGQYEIVVAQEAEKIDGLDRIIFRQLLRGLRLTDFFAHTPAVPGGRVVLISDAGSAEFAEVLDSSPTNMVYTRAVPNGKSITEVSVESAQWHRNTKRTPAPYIMQPVWDYANEDVTIRWAPRFRTIAGEFGGQTDFTPELDYHDGDYPFEVTYQVRRENPAGAIVYEETKLIGGPLTDAADRNARYFDFDIDSTFLTNNLGDPRVSFAVGIKMTNGPFAWVQLEARGS